MTRFFLAPVFAVAVMAAPAAQASIRFDGMNGVEIDERTCIGTVFLTDDTTGEEVRFSDVASFNQYVEAMRANPELDDLTRSANEKSFKAAFKWLTGFNAMRTEHCQNI